MDSIDRFRKRKEISNRLKDRNSLAVAGDQDLVNRFLNSPVDNKQVESISNSFSKVYDFEYNIKVSDSEAEELISVLKKDFDDRRFNALISSCKNDIFSSIAGPFGLGFIVSKFDKDGGNVTTVHNFENGVTATKEDAQRYEEFKKSNESFNREPYDFDYKVDRHGNLVFNKDGDIQKTQFNSTKKKEIYNKMGEGDSVVDGYTGKVIGIKTNNDISKNSQIDLEHITSVKEIETDSRNHLFANGDHANDRQKDRVDRARDDNNLTMIDGSMNSSKGEKDLKEWANKKSSKDPSKTNAEYYDVDTDLLEKEYKKSKDFLNKENLKRQIKKQGTELIITGVQESMKMGAQQAIGLVLCEFFSATFDELQDIYKKGFINGFEDERFFSVFKERLKRIANRIAERWKDAAQVFSGGFISGFLSNLVTVVINSFVRTGQRVVRIIREGFFSLLKAIKLLCFPPQGMTSAQAAHEASKLIAAGITIAGGIVLEQHIDNMIKAVPLLEPFADLLTTILVGGLTGLATTFIVYAIDKIDLFKVNDKAGHEFVMAKLENNLETLFAEGEKLIAEMSFGI